MQRSWVTRLPMSVLAKLMLALKQFSSPRASCSIRQADCVIHVEMQRTWRNQNNSGKEERRRETKAAQCHDQAAGLKTARNWPMHSEVDGPAQSLETDPPPPPQNRFLIKEQGHPAGGRTVFSTRVLEQPDLRKLKISESSS